MFRLWAAAESNSAVASSFFEGGYGANKTKKSYGANKGRFNKGWFYK